MRKLFAPGGALGIFGEHPMLLRLAAISVCAEISWATLLFVLQFHIKDDLSPGVSYQLVTARIAAVSLAFVGCETLFKVPMGHLVDRIGPRPLILFALGLCSITPLSMLLTHDWWHFAVLRTVDGLGAAALWPAMSSLMARAVPSDAKATAMSAFNGAYCLGLAVGPVIGLTLSHFLGARTVFPMCAALMAFGFLLARNVIKGELAKPPQEAEHSGGLVGNLLQGRPMLARMLLLYAVSQCAVGMFASMAAVYVDKKFGITEGQLPVLLALPALFVAACAIPLGRVGDVIGRAKAVKISYVFAAVGMLLVALTSPFERSLVLENGHLHFSPAIVLFVVGLLGLVASFILGTPAWLGLTSLQVDESQQGRALSLMQGAQGLGIVIGFALVASIGQVMAQWQVLKELVGVVIPGNDFIQRRAAMTASRAHDPIPIEVWLWASAALFAVCLIGTLRYVSDTKPDSVPDEERSEAARQPLEVTGA